MAKQAKQQPVEITPRLVDGMIKSVLACHDDIESARGKYMNAARRIRETIAAQYESAAARGIPQQLSKLIVKIEQKQAQLTGLITELEADKRKLLQKMVKAHGDRAQMALFTDLPPLPKATKAEKAEARAEKKLAGVSGSDLTHASEAAGSA